MLKKTIKIIQLILPKKIFLFIKIIYQSIKYKSYKYLYYNENLDKVINEKNLINISVNKQKIVSTLKTYDLDYNDPKLSWHYHLFAGLSNNNDNLNILEIGTHLGELTNFISNVFKSSKIYSIDLDQKDSLFINSYNRENEIDRNNFLRKRSINLNQKNINFTEMNSFDLLSHFDQNKFDIIWLDGDHTNPQVSMDVLSAYHLLKKNGILITDDIVFDLNIRSSHLVQGLQPIKYLSDIKKLKTFYFVKRVYRRNAFVKKFISFSIKI